MKSEWKNNVPSGNEAENTLSETLLEEKTRFKTCEKIISPLHHQNTQTLNSFYLLFK